LAPYVRARRNLLFVLSRSGASDDSEDMKRTRKSELRQIKQGLKRVLISVTAGTGTPYCDHSLL